MEQPLPSLTYQRRKLFRPRPKDVNYAYNILNRHVFNNCLRKPEITIRTIRSAWGLCSWLDEESNNGSWCKIELMDKWFCPQWFLNVLAHEMVHQYQWDVHRWNTLVETGKDIFTDSMGHGPTFYEWREQFNYYGLTLKKHFSQRRWFVHQDFTKC